MSRATKADKARLLNVAYRLLGQQTAVAHAAQQLADTSALSRRQAYRYLQQAAALRAPVPAVAPTVAITLKLPVHIVRALRVYARRRRLTIGQIVTQALAACLGGGRRRRG
jgi:predicted DNA-binding transcriptional regulator YafY